MPPWIWPSTSVGLIARPTSCAATMREHLAPCRARCRPRRPRSARRSHRSRRACPGRRHRAAWSADRSVPTSPIAAASSWPGRAHARRRRRARACAPSQRQPRVRPGIGSAQDLRRAAPRRPLCAALPETKVWREAEVLPASAVRSVSPATRSNCVDRQAERIGGDLGHDRVAALADIDRAVVEASACRPAASADPHGRRVGHARCCRCRTTCRRCRRRAAAAPPAALNAASRPRAAPASAAAAPRGMRPARRCSSIWPRRRRVAGAQRVAMAELQPVDRRAVGQLVHQRLVRDRGLRHAEAAEGAGGRVVGEDRRAPAPRTLGTR